MTKVSLKVFAAGLALALVASCGSRHAAKGTSDGAAPDGTAAADGGPPDAGQETAVVSDAAHEASSPDAPSDSTPNLDSLTPPDVLAADADAVADVPADAASAGDVAADADAAGGVDRAADAESMFPCLRAFTSDWRSPLETSANHWRAIRGTQGTPSVDTTAVELLLPRDSQVTNLVSPSTFVLEFDVTIDGDHTVDVDTDPPNFTNFRRLPSITRAGSQLVFSTALSGATAIAPGGGFTGQRVPAQKVHVTLFGGDHRLGMKVDAAGQSFWSGFANLDHPTQYLRLVGANLAAEQGTTAHVHVGQMTGCERVFKDDCLADPTNMLGFCATAGPSAPPL